MSLLYRRGKSGPVNLRLLEPELQQNMIDDVPHRLAMAFCSLHGRYKRPENQGNYRSHSQLITMKFQTPSHAFMQSVISA